MSRARLLALLALGLSLALTSGMPGAGAKVVNENTDNLPPGCEEISGEEEILVHGGREHASHFHGAVFTFDNRSFEMPGCTRVTVTFVNDDPIRHQFMVHGTWPDGFFMVEVDGPGQDTGTFILPSKPASLMVHCGVAQHQQKGMKGQFLVDGGVGDIPNILGISGLPPEDYQEGQSSEQAQPTPGPGALLAALSATAATWLLRPRRG